MKNEKEIREEERRRSLIIVDKRRRELIELINRDFKEDEHTSFEDWNKLIEEGSAIISNLDKIKEEIEGRKE